MEGDGPLTQTFSEKCLKKPEKQSYKDYEKDGGKSDEPGDRLFTDKAKIEYFDSLGSKNSDKIKIVYVGKVNNISRQRSQSVEIPLQKEITDEQSVNEKETEYEKHEISPKEIPEYRERGENYEIKEMTGIYKNANKMQEAKFIKSRIMKISHKDFLPKGMDEADIKRNNATPFGDSHNPENLFKEPIKLPKIERPKKSSNILKNRKFFLKMTKKILKRF